MQKRLHMLALTITSLFLATCRTAGPVATAPPDDIRPYFTPPPAWEGRTGAYRSPLLFASGERVRDRHDWERRRAEIRARWHAVMGPWPDVNIRPAVTYNDTTRRGDITQYRVDVEVAPGWTRGAWLLVPDAAGPLPAALVVYYDPDTGAGLGKLELRDFAWQLAQRGFVTLSLGSPYDSNYYPDEANARLQPLAMLACMAATSYHALANFPQVDPDRVGVVGHSYGGKWAMFASCLYDKFALGVWSDGGVVFDETRPNVNYWEPWYLGYDPDQRRERGLVTPENGRTGAYKEMIATGMDLHELHALMAPRPFLVSGGAEDGPARWQALNHAVAVNAFLGYENRVAMHNRPTHAPTEESNEVVYRFFEYFLKSAAGRQ